MRLRQCAKKRQCPHRHTEIVTTGGWHFYAGEVWDDVREYIVCLDCCNTVGRGSWNWKERVMRYYNLPFASTINLVDIPF